MVKNMSQTCPFIMNALRASETHILLAISAVSKGVFFFALWAQQTSVMRLGFLLFLALLSISCSRLTAINLSYAFIRVQLSIALLTHWYWRFIMLAWIAAAKYLGTAFETYFAIHDINIINPIQMSLSLLRFNQSLFVPSYITLYNFAYLCIFAKLLISCPLFKPKKFFFRF